MVDLTFPDGSVGEDEIFFLSISKKKKKKNWIHPTGQHT